MSERKVLNKYYPPDFDPSKIPRMKLARNRQYTVRLMAPFNMRCKTCGEYIYKGKKFNARKEDVEGDDYLGIRIYRFYIKCTRCLQEISFKTDPKNTDYEIEAGATRNFMALKLAEEQAQREEDEEKEEEATNPMKLLEKRTQQSKQELELLESLEELKDLNRRQQTINYEQMLEQFDTQTAKQRTEKEQEELDEQYIKSIFGKRSQNGTIVEEEIIEMNEKEDEGPLSKVRCKEVDRVVNHVDKGNTSKSNIEITKQRTENVFRENSAVSLEKKNLMLVQKRAKLGVKINNKSTSNKETVEKQILSEVEGDRNTNKECIITETMVAQGSNDLKSNCNPNSKSNSGGLTLLTAYSGSESDSS